LVLEDALAQLLVPVIEQVHRLYFIHPLLHWVMRGVRGTGGVFNEDRFVRQRLVHARHVVDGVVGHRRDEIPGTRRLALEWINLCRVAEQVRLPLIGVAADEAIEIVETHSSRPLIEWPRLARLEIRGVVVLAKPGCPIAIVLHSILPIVALSRVMKLS